MLIISVKFLIFVLIEDVVVPISGQSTGGSIVGIHPGGSIVGITPGNFGFN